LESLTSKIERDIVVATRNTRTRGINYKYPSVGCTLIIIVFYAYLFEIGYYCCRCLTFNGGDKPKSPKGLCYRSARYNHCTRYYLCAMFFVHVIIFLFMPNDNSQLLDETSSYNYEPSITVTALQFRYTRIYIYMYMYVSIFILL